MWILFAALAALFAGATSILAKMGLKNTDSNVVTAIRTAVVLVFAWLMVLVVGSGSEIHDISGKCLFFLVASGLATGASWLCYFKALNLGDVNKVTPVDKTSTVLSMIFAITFLHEPLTFFKFISMILIAVGTYLMIERKRDKSQPNEEMQTGAGEKHNKNSSQSSKSGKSSSWLFFASLSAIFAAVTSILGKIGVEEVDATLGTAIRTIVILIMAWIVVFVTGKQSEVRKVDKKTFFVICASGITTGASWLCYFTALRDGQASIVVPIDKLSIIVTVAFSYFILKEKVTVKSLAGLGFITAGTLLLLV